MSARDAAYNPIGYHTGSVLPHDTALAAEGLRRYGNREAATRPTSAVLEAAEAFGHRLPVDGLKPEQGAQGQQGRAVPHLPAGLDDLRLAGITVHGTSQAAQAPDVRSLRAGCDPPAPP